MRRLWLYAAILGASMAAGEVLGYVIFYLCQRTAS